jgi:hypothetical protein
MCKYRPRYYPDCGRVLCNHKYPSGITQASQGPGLEQVGVCNKPDSSIVGRVVTHSKGEYVRYTKSGPLHTNTVESAFSLLKRGIVGTYHQLSVKYLQSYCNEFAWRFIAEKNNR